jgi:hypothetical protein
MNFEAAQICGVAQVDVRRYVHGDTFHLSYLASSTRNMFRLLHEGERISRFRIDRERLFHEGRGARVE